MSDLNVTEIEDMTEAEGYDGVPPIVGEIADKVRDVIKSFPDAKQDDVLAALSGALSETITAPVQTGETTPMEAIRLAAFLVSSVMQVTIDMIADIADPDFREVDVGETQEQK